MHDDIKEPVGDQPPVDEPPSEQPPAEEPPVESPPAPESGAEPDAAPAPEIVPEPSPEQGVDPVIAEEELPAEVAAIRQALTGDTQAWPAVTSDETALLPTTGPPVAEPVPAVAESAPGEELPAGVDMGPARRSNTWVWVGLVVGILIAGAALGYAWWYTTSRPIAVPNVVGKLPPQAVQSLNDAGLRLGRVTEVATESVPAGTIVEQLPKAFTLLKPTAVVDLVVAVSPKGAKVPAVAGRTYQEAARALAESRLTAFRFESYSSTAVADFVLTQIPQPGAQLQPGAYVVVVVSKGQMPSQVRTPHLAGLPEAEAATLLKVLGLRGIVSRSINSSVPAGEVVTQTPLPTTQVPFESTVHYLISQGSGSTPVVVPSVSGIGRKSAENRLKAKSLKFQIVRVASPSVAKGRVISQMPLAGMRAPRASTVSLLVSLGNSASGSTPDLASKPTTEAQSIARKSGFSPVIVEVDTLAFPPGQIFGQYPEPNTFWPLNLPIVAITAREP